MSTWLHDARLVSLAAVAGALGHPVDRRGARCPLCQHEEACKAFASTRWHCHACGQGGDVVDLVCAVLTGERYHRRHIDAVRGWFASQGWCDEALAWARTRRAGAVEQEWLFEQDPEDPSAGCLRWGMCEHPAGAA